ncbi:aarA, partial [Symbiodinium pilosum]
MLEDPLYAREVVAYTNAVRAAAQFLADEEVQYCFCFAMSFSATRYPNIVLKAGGLKCILDAMKKYPKNTRLQAEACEALRNIAEMPDGADTLLSTTALEDVLNSMKMNAQAEWVVQEGCGMVCRMITESDDARDRLMKGEGLRVIMDCMETFPRASWVRATLPAPAAIMKFLFQWLTYSLKAGEAQLAMGKFKDKLLAAATFGGVAFVGMAISSNPTLKAKATELTYFMRRSPLLGVVLHAVFSTAITVSGIPFSLVDLGAAWVYGFQAALGMLLFSKTLGSILCFLVARSILPASRKASVLSHPTVARVDRILASSPIYYGTLFRLALLPAFVKNYGLALLNIRFPHYLVCCLLGSCFGVPAQAYLGSQLGDIYLGLRDAESVDPVVLLGGIAPVLFLVILMPTMAKVLLGKDEDPNATADVKKT